MSFPNAFLTILMTTASSLMQLGISTPPCNNGNTSSSFSAPYQSSAAYTRSFVSQTCPPPPSSCLCESGPSPSIAPLQTAKA